MRRTPFITSVLAKSVLAASMIIAPLFLRMPLLIALISGRLLSMSKHMISSFRLPGTNVDATLRPVSEVLVSAS